MEEGPKWSSAEGTGVLVCRYLVIERDFGAMVDRHKVVIIGGGFGGLDAARALKNAPVDVTLIDRRNYHLFQPLLYQVATGALSPADIASPLRHILRKQKNTRVLLAEAVEIDTESRKVRLKDGEAPYDSLVIAAGAQNYYFGHDHWGEYAPGLKTIEDATRIRRRILMAFEEAEKETDPDRIRVLLTFVVIGGGPTGVELAGTLGEIAFDALRRDFRRIDPAKARIILIDSLERILPTYHPTLSARATRALEKKFKVTVKTGWMVSEINADTVTIKRGEETENIRARSVLWAAGVKASPMGNLLSRRARIETDRMGRIKVNSDLSVPGYPEIFVVGDLAYLNDREWTPLPGTAPVAKQEGQYVARLIRRRLKGKATGPFHFRNFGIMATIGKKYAVADFGFLKISGYIGWLAWLFVHLMYIVEFENRVLILVQWAWNYFTGNRSARLITEECPPASSEISENSGTGVKMDMKR